MLVNQPFYAIMLSVFYLGVIYLLVKRENKYISYGLTILASLIQVTFLYFWFEKTKFLMESSNLGLQVFENFYRFVNTSYFILFIPLLLILAWYGIRKIAIKSHSLLSKIISAVFYIAVLIGLLVFGEFIFIVLFYGFAP